MVGLPTPRALHHLEVSSLTSGSGPELLEVSQALRRAAWMVIENSTPLVGIVLTTFKAEQLFAATRNPRGWLLLTYPLFFNV